MTVVRFRAKARSDSLEDIRRILRKSVEYEDVLSGIDHATNKHELEAASRYIYTDAFDGLPKEAQEEVVDRSDARLRILLGLVT